MNSYFSSNIISEIIRIDERILNSMYELSKIHDVSDYYHYMSLISDIRVLHKKENHLISQIPKDHEIYNYILDFLDDSSNYGLDDPKNSTVVIARVYGLIHSLYMDLAVEKCDDSDDESYYEVLNMRDKAFIRNNLLCEYISTLSDCIKISQNNGVEQFFYNIQLYNVFINYNMFNSWVNCGFDFDNMNAYSDEIAMKILDVSSQDYDYLKEDVVIDCIAQLLPQIFIDSKRPKGNLLIQDSFFNFKFLISKLSDEDLFSLKESLEDAHFEIGKYGLLGDVISTVYSELNSRTLSLDDDDINSDYNTDYDIDNYDLFVSLIKLEDKLLDTFQKFSFDKVDNKLIDELLGLVAEEKKLISSINFLSIISVVNDVLDKDLWVYLSGDKADYKGSLIVKRLKNLLPVFREMSYSPIHNEVGFKYIRKNHFIRSLSEFRNSAEFESESAIGVGCKRFYKLFYFINPDLFEELLMCNGNDLFMYDMSDSIVREASLMDEDEYQFDKNEYLYGIGEALIRDFFDNENYISSVSDYVNLVFKFARLNDVIDNCDIKYVTKLYNYLNANSNFFSPLRRDLRKIFKARIFSENVKVRKIGRNKNS